MGKVGEKEKMLKKTLNFFIFTCTFFKLEFINYFDTINLINTYENDTKFSNTVNNCILGNFKFIFINWHFYAFKYYSKLKHVLLVKCFLIYVMMIAKKISILLKTQIEQRIGMKL